MRTTPEALMRDVVERSKIPQAELARLSGISYATLHAWLNGKRNPSPDSLRKVAEGLDRYGSEMQGLAGEVREWLDANG